MSTLIKINVTNNSNSLQNLFFFQQPASYTGGPNVYSNSIQSTSLEPYATSGSVYTFLINLQFYAGVQERYTPPVIGEQSGYTSAIQAIDLAPAAGGTPTNNKTIMVIKPLGLSTPINDPAVQPGAFRIVSPIFDPNLSALNAGSAVKLANGSVVLSNFVTAAPNTNLDCQPVLKFYVQTGNYTAGTVMNFTASSATAALCDATAGYTTFNVSYQNDGSWKVTPSVSKFALKADDFGNINVISNESGNSKAISNQLNVEIRNEAGSAVISQGTVDNLLSPLTINNLSHPNEIKVYGTYQIGPINGPYIGADCIAKDGNSAVFAR